jgi:RNA polymerase sigma-70 factor (ECF subfamily)
VEHHEAETQLLLRAGRGDAEAFRLLYAALYVTVRSFITNRYGHLDGHEIDDVTQDVFLRAWAGAANFQGRASAKTYLLGIAKNVLRETIRRRTKTPVPLTGGMGGQSHDPLFEGEALFVRAVERAKSRLTEEQRVAFELVHVQGLSIAEAANHCHCNPNQFRNRLWRARERLREMLRHLPEAMSG